MSTTDAIVLVGKSASAAVALYLETVSVRGLKVTLEVTEDECGSADALRSVADKIKTDFVVISGDLISDVRLQHLADVHRMKDATVSILLARAPADKGKGKGDKKRKPAADSMDARDVVGLVEKDSRIVYLASGADVEDGGIRLRKPLLRRFPRLALRSSYVDTHVYIFTRWVLDLLIEKTSFSSIKAHLVPFLVNKQFRRSALASLAHLAAPDYGLMGMDSSISSFRRGQGENDVPDEVPAVPTTSDGMLSLPGSGPSGAPRVDSVDSNLSMALLSSAAVSPQEISADALRCFYYVTEPGVYARRINSLDAYMAANRDVPSKAGVLEFKPLVPPSSRHQFIAETVELENINAVGSESCIGESTILGADATVKKANIGAHCKLGSASKVVSSVVSDHVEIGAGSTLTNCVVGTRARIGENVTLVDCKVGASASVEAGESLENRVVL